MSRHAITYAGSGVGTYCLLKAVANGCDATLKMLIHHLLSLASSFPGLPFLVIHLMLHAIVGAWTPIPSTLGPTPIAAGVLALLQHRGHLIRQ